mmetsp:Transcript_9554/g.28687  ORF Transcript_9554/g.28687 Transcript_9554/m.28687 type:complete len:96 (+) Transcript_9554:2109-2396(+)
MQRIGEVKRRALKFQGLSNDSRTVAVAMPQQLRVEPRQSSIFPDEALIYCRGGDDCDTGPSHNLLKSASIMICVAVRYDDSNDHTRTYTLTLQCS